MCYKTGPVEPSETHLGLHWMDSLELFDFSSFIIFSDFPWSPLSAFVSFLNYCWLFNVATSFVNGPKCNMIDKIMIIN